MTTLDAQFATRGLDWIVPAWNGPRAVRAFFTTRNGPVGWPSEGGMDLGPAQLDEGGDGALDTNRRLLRAMLPGDPVWLAQVHGRVVIAVNGGNHRCLLQSPPTADAAITRDADLPLIIRTADCLPVLFADRAGQVLAVAHAGWRGLAAGVLEATLAAMEIVPAQVVAWIGPAIGPRAFEVGADVHDAYCSTDPAACALFEPLRDGRWLADLPGLARQRLAKYGVTDVASGDWCTVTDAARFFSWRRERQVGRMGLVAWLEREA